MMTPYDKLKSLPQAEGYLKPGAVQFPPKGLKPPLKSSELVPITLHARVQAYSRLAGVLLMPVKEV
ncbi:hypothetical protein AFERRID_24370 [Acidithiobacillus ferridurans]|uniref:Uncharacterized protein n=1 Tax=Acidithiobacillus ferridurans TaxID=1232575 RepID=A0A2Z6IL68_ACIFI|nr:hypothetical protein GGI1_23231 [Acidithiobacillus sp. GGI-221]BBF66219.1 hypothetical protein AFERRID_24370 [Acidithiobacillus ferridurans]BDB14929.1 hypothetical protein ANFP_22490 [Acidithiobacillus ferrooxidans]